MQSAQISSNTVLGTILSRTNAAGLASRITIVVLGALFITVCAKAQVPVWPVPVTLQGFAIAAIAAGFGLRIGVATVGLYLMEGAAGLPVFSGGGGLAYFSGPTAGFLVGFLVMAAIIGAAADRGASRKPLSLFAAMLAGNAALLAIGFVWLLSMAGASEWLDQNNLVASAFAGAIQPFIVWDILKMALAAATITGLWNFTTRS
jgi:biotin transport system substrate-specific component